MQKKLTDQEETIVNLMVEGASVKEIAYKLNISKSAVYFHRNNIYIKLGISSFKELLAKYGTSMRYTEEASFVSSEISPFVNPENRKKRVNIRLTPIQLLLIVVCASLILWLFIKLSVKEPSAKDGEITLPDGSTFVVPVFETVYLYADKFIVDVPYDHHGEQISSLGSIELSDFYPPGINSFLPKAGDAATVKISGTVDRNFNNLVIELHHISPDRKKYTYLGKSLNVEIGPGEFNETLRIYRQFDQDIPQDGYIEFRIEKRLFEVADGPDYKTYFDSGERIPEDVPNGKIMATIRNLKIEPVM